jgi:hypothetical protein
LQESLASRVTSGLDTAEKRRLLDQRITLQTKCQVASGLYLLYKGSLTVAAMLGWIAKSSRQMQPNNKSWPAYTGFGNPS